MPEMEGPPGGLVSLAVEGARPGPRKSHTSAKWEIYYLDRAGFIATYKK